MTKIVKHINNIPYFGEENLLKIVENRSFSSMIFELLSGNRPNEIEDKIFNLILNISIDHGSDTPSAIETINSAKTNKGLSESVARGIAQINNIHGGAIEPAMELLYKINSDNINISKFTSNQINSGKKIPGFGHRIYTIDPRTELIYKVARSLGFETDYLDITESIANEIKKIKQKTIPVNIDGAIAAILCTFGWKPNLGKAVFIIARVSGLCGHYLNSTIYPKSPQQV